MGVPPGDRSDIPIPSAPETDREASQPPFGVETVSTDAGISVLVRGELDPATRAPFRRALEAALEGAPDVVVDLREVTFMDSTGLAVLVGAHESATSGQGRLVVRDPSPAIQRLLVITALDGVLVTEHTDQAAGVEDERAERPAPRPLEPSFRVTNLENGQVIEVRLDRGALAEQWPAIEPKILSLIQVRQPRELRLRLEGGAAELDSDQFTAARASLAALGGRLVVEPTTE